MKLRHQFFPPLVVKTQLEIHELEYKLRKYSRNFVINCIFNKIYFFTAQSTSRFMLKIFLIKLLKTAAIANLFHFSQAAYIDIESRNFLSFSPLSLPSLSIFLTFFLFYSFTSRSHFESIVLHHLRHSCRFRDFLSRSVASCTYLCVLRCCFYRIMLCPSALFVRSCTLLIRAANRIRIRLNLSPLWQVSLYAIYAHSTRKCFPFTLLHFSKESSCIVF